MLDRARPPRRGARHPAAGRQFIHISSDYYHEPMVRLAEKLDEIAPFEEPAVSFLTNSGTEAVEAALKLARLTPGART